jgi:predicted nucleotidyltransferase
MSITIEEIYRLALQLDETDRQRLVNYLTQPPPALTVDQILKILNQHAEELHQHGVEQIGVFGSQTRAEAGQASDVDILVQTRQVSLTGFVRLKLYLEELLGRPVDLVPADSIRPELRTNILREVVYAEGV